MDSLADKKPKQYGIKDFCAARQGEKIITVDALMLGHTGDTVTLSVAHQPEVQSITVQVNTHIQAHEEGTAGLNINTPKVDKTLSKRIKLTSGEDYQITVKEQFKASATEVTALGIGGAGLAGTTNGMYIDNIDVRVTLVSVQLEDGGDGQIGQAGVTAGLAWDAVANGLMWILGAFIAAGCVYMLYRVWRWKKHGEALVPGWGK